VIPDEKRRASLLMKEKTAHNQSLHWIFTPLRCVKTSEFKRYATQIRIARL